MGYGKTATGLGPGIRFESGGEFSRLVLTHRCLVLRCQVKLPRWFESTWGLGWLTVWLIELNWNLDRCDIGTVTGPEPGIRCDANPVTSLRRRPWLVGAWVCVIKFPGGSSPPKLFIWYDCDVNGIVNCLWLILSFQALALELQIYITLLVILPV